MIGCRESKTARCFAQTLWLLLIAGALLATTACARSSADPTSRVVPTHTPAPASAATRSPGAGDVYDPPVHRLQPGELVLAAEDDNIPAIFAADNHFVDAEAGSREWQDEELVIGLVLDGEARAYPVRLLSAHEIVNDTVAGRPIAVTWCPLCYSALVFERVAGRELTFGVSGYLFRNNLVMYDHQTNTLWSQLQAQGIRGALRGERLATLPSVLTPWSEWKSAHPHTLVLSAQQLGQNAEAIVDPYAGYYASGVAGLTGTFDDERLPAKALVVGLVSGDQARAYPVALLKDKGVFNDRLGDLPLLLVYDAQLQSVRAYRRDVGQVTLAFELVEGRAALRDQPSGSLWDVQRGVALDGPLQGARLQRLSAPLVYWFAWLAQYPQTELER